MPANGPDYTGLVKAGMSIRMQAPEAWDDLVQEMQRYAVQMSNQMVGAPIELLQRAQGMAIATHEIAGVLRDVPKLAEQMGQRQHGRR